MAEKLEIGSHKDTYFTAYDRLNFLHWVAERLAKSASLLTNSILNNITSKTSSRTGVLKNITRMWLISRERRFAKNYGDQGSKYLTRTILNLS
jgi:hypothetical protein